ncbi:hypothetical protein SORBI_3009G131032 [Sorghum bicolor]|uniref:Uncharacterized protein n=1 Tax=Sorghum bicolor TaxID=4558 RepID=A0A1Z5R352_SORBI|nr:hypothetical protein SORBI_3009G131032 [Sorghum bicolor]
MPPEKRPIATIGAGWLAVTGKSRGKLPAVSARGRIISFGDWPGPDAGAQFPAGGMEWIIRCLMTRATAGAQTSCGISLLEGTELREASVGMGWDGMGWPCAPSHGTSVESSFDLAVTSYRFRLDLRQSGGVSPHLTEYCFV